MGTKVIASDSFSTANYFCHDVCKSKVWRRYFFHQPVSVLCVNVKFSWRHILQSFMEIREGFFFELCEVIMPCMCFIMLVRPGCSNYNNFLLSVTSSFVVINTKIKRNRAISENNISLYNISL